MSKLTVLVIFLFSIQTFQLHAQCNLSHDSSINHQFERLFIHTSFKIDKRAEKIDSSYLECYKSLFSEPFLIANPGEVFNETDMVAKGFPYRRLVNCGRNGTGHIAYVLYEMDKALYLDIFNKKNNSITSFISYQLPTSFKNGGVEKIKQAIFRKVYLDRRDYPRPPLFREEVTPPNVPKPH